MSIFRRASIASSVGACLAIAACTATQQGDLVGFKDGRESPPSFAVEDAEVVEAEAGLISYCPSSKCPTGRTTCLVSAFRCDVDLRTDKMNCGACGVACPNDTNYEAYECIEGHCVMHCKARYLDCDGLPDNGCELDRERDLNDDHCGACGNECRDPAKPCSLNAPADVGCGCPGSEVSCNRRCVDVMIDDNNCATCGTACDRSGGGQPVPQHMYYGCGNGECGHLKCQQNWANCDGDTSNGCEVDLTKPENCGRCGSACDPGQECRFHYDLGMNAPPRCMCPDGLTLCGRCTVLGCFGLCVDIKSDPENCSACGVQCQTSFFGEFGFESCTYGVCTLQCPKGHADCNGEATDYCETNTDNDPANCGACGRTCDIAAGQACAGGECVVEPCDRVQDAGEVAR